MKYSVYIFLLFPYFLFGQNQKVFTDSLGTRAIIEYSGTWNDTALPESGHYKLNTRVLNSNGITTTRAAGKLRNGVPDNKWTWKLGFWNYNVHAGNDIKPKFTTHGEVKSWNGSFKNGRPHGKWNFTSSSIAPDEKALEKIKIQSEFNSGNISGFVKITSDEFIAEGTLTDSGIAAGTWHFNYLDSLSGHRISEERHYANGVLTKITLTDDYSGEVFYRRNPVPLTESETIDFAAFLNYPVNIGTRRFARDGMETKGSGLLRDFIAYLTCNGWQADYFHYIPERQGPHYKKLNFPFTKKEIAAVDHVHSLIDSLKTACKARLDYCNILLKRGKTEELDLALSYAQAVKQRISIADSLLQAVQHELFIYENRHSNEYREKFNGNLNHPDTIYGEVYETVYAVLPQGNYLNENVFIELERVLVEVKNELPVYLQTIDQSYDELKKEGELADLETEISRKTEMVDSLYANASGTKKVVKETKVKYVKSDLMSKYSKIENYAEAKEKAAVISGKLDYLIERHNEWDLLDSAKYKLQERYTTYEYNPYSGKRDIEVKKKKRFMRSVLEQLLPHLKSEFSEIEDFQEWKEHWELTKSVYDRLLEFAEENDRHAKRTERKIRRSDDPERMIRMLL